MRGGVEQSIVSGLRRRGPGHGVEDATESSDHLGGVTGGRWENIIAASSFRAHRFCVGLLQHMKNDRVWLSPAGMRRWRGSGAVAQTPTHRAGGRGMGAARPRRGCRTAGGTPCSSPPPPQSPTPAALRRRATGEYTPDAMPGAKTCQGEHGRYSVFQRRGESATSVGRRIGAAWLSISPPPGM